MHVTIAVYSDPDMSVTSPLPLLKIKKLLITKNIKDIYG